MATSGFSPVTFFDTCDGAFYFEAAETDVDGDDFGISPENRKRFVQSADNKYLVLNDEDQFQAQNLTTHQQCQPDCKFKIQIYQDSDTEGNIKRKPVMLYIEKDDKKMVVCCSNEHNIYSKEMVLPQHIGGNEHKAVFYMMGHSTSTCMYMFESSLYQKKFLAFQDDDDNPSLKKLVLRHKDDDQVNVSCEVTLSEYNN